MIKATGTVPGPSPEPAPHHNQFALGRGVSPPPGWASVDLGTFGTLVTHPGLSVTRARADGQHLILLGDLFDWQRPGASNENILNRIAADEGTLEGVLAATAELGGRWAVLRFRADEAALFHDAAGMRSICYGKDPDGHLAAASDQGMLSRIARLPADEAAMAFVDAFSRRVSQWWLPGDKLLFEGGRQLLPNHALCLRTGTAGRYWPAGDITGDPAATLLERCAARLEGFISAAAHRYTLAMGLRAGWDNRLILAFCRGVKDSLRTYSTVPPGRRHPPPDAKLPARLCATLGLTHELLLPQHEPSAGFRRAFQGHVYLPHAEFAPFMEAELALSRYETAGVTGNIAEVVKLPYEEKIRERDFDDRNPAQLARLVRMHGFEYAATALDQWRSSAADHPRVTIPELFYWENRCGRWLSRNTLMFDIGWREIVMPFNCRALLSDFLEIDPELRRRPECFAFESLIERRWPEVLSVPIVSKTPVTGYRRLWSRSRQLLRRLFREGFRKAD